MGCSGLVKDFLLIQKWSIRSSLKGGLDVLLWGVDPGLQLTCSPCANGMGERIER